MDSGDTAQRPSAMARLEGSERELHRLASGVASLLEENIQLRQLLLALQQQGTNHAERLDRLTTAVAAGEALRAAPAVNTPPPLAPVPALPLAVPEGPEPRIGDPERFDGDPDEVEPFLTNCRLVFDLRPRNFASEAAKVAYTINLLTGRARLWGTAEYQRGSPACSSFHLLAAELQKVFGVGSSSADASRELMEIRQGRRTVADFSISFRTLASRSRWNSEAVVDAYLHSLADYIKDELVAHEVPSTLDEAIALTTRIDQRIQARRREKGRSSQVQSSARSSGRPAQALRPSASPRRSSPEPMELGRASLTPEERHRRLTAGLCLYCGGEGHLVATCPLKDRAHRR